MKNNVKQGNSVTVRDIAKTAGVSPATVSRYYSGSTVVSRELASRIEDVSEKLGYVHQHKRRKEGRVIAVMLPDLELMFYRDVLREIFAQLPRYQYRMVIIPYEKGEQDYKRFFSEMNIEGVIYLDEEIDSEILRYILSKNIRTVMCGGPATDNKSEMVHVKDMLAAYEGMKYLIQLHHERILILSDYANKLGSTFQRLVGCKKAMEEFGLPIVEDLFAHGKITYEMGYRLTKKVLYKQVDFSAIFAFSDEMAMGAIRALHESGIQVPEDVSVLGFDDISFSEKYNPPLTTIHQPIQEFVTQSLNFFLEKEERNKNVDIIFPFRIIERASCQENRQK